MHASAKFKGRAQKSKAIIMILFIKQLHDYYVKLISAHRYIRGANQ